MSETHRVRPLFGPVDAIVEVPGSKSIANRALVCAALARGRSQLANMPDGDDTAAMVGCLRALGLDASRVGDRATVSGAGGEWPYGERTLDTGLAGTTSRFVTALAALGGGPFTIDGAPPLRRRPFGPLHDALAHLGVAITPGGASGRLPTVVEGPPTGRSTPIRGDVSSQFITALMLIAPLLTDGLRIELTTPLVSRPYVEMTAAVMGWFGGPAVEHVDESIVVAPGRYRPADIAVEPDASSASYPLAVAAVVGGRVSIPGLGLGALQGDARFADVLASMGCTVTRTRADVTVGRDLGQPLEGVDIDMADVSDLVPTVAVVAAFADSPTRIRGVGFIRSKESDRLGDLTAELRSVGVDLDETGDGLEIRPSGARLRSGLLGTHHDHRLAMAFGVLGCAVPDILIEDADVVSKSWPGYWAMLARSFP